MNIQEIALKLKELGARAFGGNVWEKASATPEFASVTAEVVKNEIIGADGKAVTLASLRLPLPAGHEDAYVNVRLGKGVPADKPTYDIYKMVAKKAWTPRPGQKGEAILAGAIMPMAF